MKHSRRILFLFAALCLLVACKEGLPKGILSERKMEKVLYDYHRAEAVARILNVDSATQALYMDAVLQKNGVDRADFDSSMVYYTRHMDLMQHVYENLAKRVEREAQEYGMADVFADGESLSGDTSNIWPSHSAQVLMINQPYNVVSYTVKADSSFQKGDKFLLRFNSQFLYQDGQRHGTAVLAMRLANDSVVVRNTRLSMSNTVSLEVSDTERMGVKEVRGFILHNTPTQEEDRKSTTMKMLMLSGIKLIRMHVKEEVKTDSLATDSLKTDSLRTDSLHRLQKDSVEKQETQHEQKPMLKHLSPPRKPVTETKTTPVTLRKDNTNNKK